MKKYDIVIFDLDGTLINTLPGIMNSVRYTIEKMGFEPLSDEAVQSFAGPPILQNYTIHFGVDADTAVQAAKYHREYTGMQGIYEASLYDGIAETLEQLKNSGYKLAVATNKSQNLAEKILEHFQLTRYFEMITGTDVSEKLKKSEMIKMTEEKLGNSKPVKTVLVGDSKFDALAAKDAGIDFIGVTYGFGFAGPEDLKPYEHVAVFSSVKELPGFLDN